MAGIAIVKTSRRDMDEAQAKSDDKLASLVIDFSENGGGTVRCITRGGGPFGGEPKTYSFESPESLSQFVAGKIVGTGGEMASDEEDDAAEGDLEEAADVAAGPVEADVAAGDE